MITVNVLFIGVNSEADVSFKEVLSYFVVVALKF